MKKPDKYIIFLNNKYIAENNTFYLKHLKGRITIAADAGIQFFLKNKIKPDILIGDLDSSPRLSAKYMIGIKIIEFPSRKNKTDFQLAVELALERGAKSIEICGALSVTEIDHTLGNIFLLNLIKKFSQKNKIKIDARIISPAGIIILLENESISLKGKRGDYLSIIPLQDGCTAFTSGLTYPHSKELLKFGDTLTLRNQFKAKRARIEVRGKIIVVASLK